MGHQQATRLRDLPGRLTHLAGRTGSAAHRSLGPDRSYFRLVRASLASCTIAALGWKGLAGSTRRLDAAGTEEPNGVWLRTGWRRESPAARAGPTRGVPPNFQKPCVFCTNSHVLMRSWKIRSSLLLSQAHFKLKPIYILLYDNKCNQLQDQG